MDLTDYIVELSVAVDAATAFLRQEAYTDEPTTDRTNGPFLLPVGYDIDSIGSQRMYPVKTVLPGAPNVCLMSNGKFVLIENMNVTSLQDVVNVDGRYLTPKGLLEFVVETAEKRGSTSPSDLSLTGILQVLVYEIKVLPSSSCT